MARRQYFHLTAEFAGAADTIEVHRFPPVKGGWERHILFISSHLKAGAGGSLRAWIARGSLELPLHQFLITASPGITLTAFTQEAVLLEGEELLFRASGLDSTRTVLLAIYGYDWIQEGATR